METKLPDKDSELIRLALADMQTVEADSRYQINMGEWHDMASGDGKCHVCMAGSVMAGTLKVNHGLTYFPYDFDSDTAEKLESLNQLRTGRSRQEPELNRVIVPYKFDREQFYKEMNQFADDLEAAGF